MKLGINVAIVRKRTLVHFARRRCLESHHVLQQNDAGEQICSFAAKHVAKLGNLLQTRNQMQETLASRIVQLLLLALMIVLSSMRLAGWGHDPDVGLEHGQVQRCELFNGVGGQGGRWWRRSPCGFCPLLILLVALLSWRLGIAAATILLIARDKVVCKHRVA